MDKNTKLALTNYYESFLREERKNKLTEVLNNRTRYLTVVLEDIYHSHNASAVLRNCDAFGIQDVHIIENNHEYNVNPGVVRGSAKWLTLHKYAEHKNNTLDCIEKLRSQGYKIVATSPGDNIPILDNYEITDKTALVFGTEKTGISQTIIDQADAFLKIPMYGFVESFNISVSVALLLENLTKKIKSSSTNWNLTETEKNDIYLDWVEKSVRKPELLKEEFLSKLKDV